MHILVLQHERVEHPGIFRDFLKSDGHTWDAIELDQGEAFPSFDGYDALWVLGGPMDVWQEDEYPWLKQEKTFIREAVRERGLPYLGLCLGHQLLAEALGGEVGPSKTPEIGVMPVNLTNEGSQGELFDGVSESFNCLQWHSAEVIRMPEGGVVLASSPACESQAMKWGSNVYSLQFHVEIEIDTVKNWSKIPEYAAALESAMGEGAVDRFDAEAAANMRDFNAMAERIYNNWLRAITN
ncbi:MAG: type 1 glutamine amidotransferase [Pseudomonadota bacterium]